MNQQPTGGTAATSTLPSPPPGAAAAAIPESELGAGSVLAALWQQAGLPAEALNHVQLTGDGPVLPSSFAVATAAQASLGAAALAAAEVWYRRTGQRQQVTVPRTAAVLESTAHFAIDGKVPALWDKLSGLYRCGTARGVPGWVRIHANFAHHRDGALRLLGCATGPATERADVAAALAHWAAEDFETAAADAGLVVAAARDFAAWDAHPQAQALAGQPPVQLRRIGDAPPLHWPRLAADGPPLGGLRVLELTRILAGPVAGRTLAAYGANVLLVNGPHLPNIEALADTSRGKRSTLIDLRDQAGGAALMGLVGTAHVLLQGYRPGTLAARGFGPEALAAARPGIVVVSLSAYGSTGPWRGRRGFDSLVQTATGFNFAEAEAAGAQQPQAMPMQILDYAAGYLMAFGAQAALWRQACEGGSWLVEVSLAGVAAWLRGMGRVPGGLAVPRPELDQHLVAQASGFGVLAAMPHAAAFSRSLPFVLRPSMPPGSHPPVWVDD